MNILAYLTRGLNVSVSDSCNDSCYVIRTKKFRSQVSIEKLHVKASGGFACKF